VFEIGNSLREARLRQGLDFPRVEADTKIRGKYLQALEAERFEILPAETYVKGFLRTYAEYLGLDGQLYVDEFNSRYVRGEFEEEEEQQQPFRPRVSGSGLGGGFQSKAVLLTVAVIAGLTVFTFAAWMWGGRSDQDVLPLTNNPPPAKPTKPTARLVAWSVGGGSYLVVRRDSRTSKPIYSGTLEGGRKQRFVGRRLWVYVYAPANLRLKLNGREKVVPGAGTGARRWLEVTPSRVSLASPPA
jgi:helix-turn-helix protein